MFYKKIHVPFLVSLFSLFLIGGCATPPIPAGYTGPIATIRDSTFSETSHRSQFFYLKQIDGNTVENVLGKTRSTNYGRGFSLQPVQFSREIPAKAVTLTLEANIAYGAPIQEMLNTRTMYTATKQVSFIPEPNKTYVVRGQLTSTTQDVWLEDASTGQRIE